VPTIVGWQVRRLWEIYIAPVAHIGNSSFLLKKGKLSSSISVPCITLNNPSMLPIILILRAVEGFLAFLGISLDLW
jgi:hypothetical protein